MKRPEFKVGEMYVRQLFSRPVNAIPEDSNVLYYANAEAFHKDLVRRARCVMGFRGASNADALNVNLNAVQHAERMVVGGFSGSFNVDEHIVAEYACLVASETEYYGQNSVHTDVLNEGWL